MNTNFVVMFLIGAAGAALLLFVLTKLGWE